MQNGYALNAEQVEKIIRYYTTTCGRQVDAEGIRFEAARFAGSFRTATDAVDTFRCVIWNKGLVW